jgi:hypothetical protein
LIGFGVPGVFQREKLAKNSQKLSKMSPKSLKFSYCLLWLTHDHSNGYDLLYIFETHIPVYHLIGFGVPGVFQREKLAKNSLKLSKMSPKSLKFSYCLLWLTHDHSNGYDLLYIFETHIPVYHLIGFGVPGVFQREKLAKNSLKLSKMSPKSLKFSYCLLWLTHDHSNGYDLLYIFETHIPVYHLIGFGVPGVFQREKLAKNSQKLSKMSPKSLKFSYCLLWLTHDHSNGYDLLYIFETHIPVYHLIGFGVPGVFQREKLAKNSLKLSKMSPKSLKFSYCLLWLTHDHSNGYDLLYIFETHIPVYHLIGFGGVWGLPGRKIGQK